jgi:hypothetical protein
MKTPAEGARRLEWAVAGLLSLSVLGWAFGDPAARVASVAGVRNNGAVTSQFCTKNGQITVVHSGWNDANGSYAIGGTLLTGQTTYRLANGNASIQAGCYQHTMFNTSVVGNAWAKSTVWYDQ